MRDERYSIEVGDNYVEIHGDLTIEETFDYLNFFEKKGFKSITGGWENSTLVLSRKGVEEKWEELRQKEHVESEAMYETFFKSEQKEHEQTKRRLSEVEALVKALFSDESEKVKVLKAQNEVLYKAAKQTKLSENEEFKKILNSFACLPSGHTINLSDVYIDPSRIHADPLSIPDPEEASC